MLFMIYFLGKVKVETLEGLGMLESSKQANFQG
jgi:hypothetical protein